MFLPCPIPSFAISAQLSRAALLAWLLLLGAGRGAEARPLLNSQLPSVVVVNAASFNVPTAPDSIAAAFFANQSAIPTVAALALPLPTELAGVRLEVNGRVAGLFFISPGQINFLVPEQTTAGTATVNVRMNGMTVASGQVPIQTVAPGIFTANSTGRGVPAGLLYPGTAPPTLPFECAAGRNPRCLPVPIDLCTTATVASVFLTGIRLAPDPNGDGNLNESVRVLIGSKSYQPAYAGRQGSLVGLDQLNVALPSELANSGLTGVTLAVGGVSSNLVELDFSTAGAIRVERVEPNNVVAGQPLAISGVGFSSNKEKNIVRILGAEGQADAQVVDATPTQLTVLVPFGAESGRVSVTNLSAQCAAGISPGQLGVKTSISGFFKDTSGNKIEGLTVRVVDAANVSKPPVTTNKEGAFVVAELAPGLAEVEIDASTAQSVLPFPAVRFKVQVVKDRDKQLDFPGSLQPANGTSSNLTAEGLVTEPLVKVHAPAEPAGRISNGNVILDIPDNATIRFPDGSAPNRITLSLVNRSLTPVSLPERHFSSTIVQIAPTGAIIRPGAKLTFPNGDGFPAGSPAQLFRLDQQRGSPTLGQFIPVGTATVSSDGQRIETAAEAVTETTIYFVSIPRTTITVVGNVVELDQIPVRRALLGSRGQSGFTDGNGGFVVRTVPVNALNPQIAEGTLVRVNEQGQAQVGADLLAVEANYLRPTKIVSRQENNNVVPSAGNLTSAGILVLDPPPPDNPPTIIAPTSSNIFAGQPQDIPLVIMSGGGESVSVSVSVTGASFASVRASNNDYFLRLTPSLTDRGAYNLVITAINGLGRLATHRLALTVQ